MKKKIFYTGIGIIMFLSKTIQAQGTSTIQTSNTNQETTKDEKPEPAFHNGIFGVRYMPTFSNIKVQNSDGTSVKGDVVMGYGFGGLLGFNFNKNVGVQVEVIYNQFSQKYKDHTLDRRIDINYINIPALLSLNTNRMSEVNFNVVVGPQWGINVGSKLQTSGTGNGNSNKQAILAVKKNDFGIAYGAGLDFGLNHMRSIRLDVGFRGVLGLINISDQSQTLETNSYYVLTKDQIKTYSGYIGLTFLF